METGLRILGIDPGSRLMGYGLIAIKERKIRYVESGTLRFDPNTDALTRLGEVQKSMAALIERLNPTHLAAEAPFQGKSVQSMLKLGRVQGVVIATAMARGLICAEYSPARVKQSLTGSGRSTKEQVAWMVGRLFDPKVDPSLFESQGPDATDALGVALCHAMGIQSQAMRGEHRLGSSSAASDAGIGDRNNTPKSGSKPSKGWADFLQNNPDRLK